MHTHTTWQEVLKNVPTMITMPQPGHVICNFMYLMMWAYFFQLLSFDMAAVMAWQPGVEVMSCKSYVEISNICKNWLPMFSIYFNS